MTAPLMTLPLLIVPLLLALTGCERGHADLPQHILEATPLPLPTKPENPSPPAKTYLASSKGMTVEVRSPAKTANDQLQKATARTLAQLGSPAVPTLIQLLKAGSPEEQMQAAQSLAWMGPEAVSATEPLVVMLENPSTSAPLQVACVRAIGEIGPAIWPVEPTRPKAKQPQSPPSLDAEGAGQVNAADPAEIQWQEAQRTYQRDMVEYQRRLELAQRAVRVVARIMQQQASS